MIAVPLALKRCLSTWKNMLEELTDKQRNMICYNLDYVFPEYLPFEYKDKLMHIIYNVKMETMDGCEMVGEVFNISKDKREMVTKKDKIIYASELKRLIDKYSDYK